MNVKEQKKLQEAVTPPNSIRKKKIVHIISCVISFLLMIPLVKLLVTFLPSAPGTNTVDFIRTLLIIFLFCVVFNICSHFCYMIVLRIDKSGQ